MNEHLVPGLFDFEELLNPVLPKGALINYDTYKRLKESQKVLRNSIKMYNKGSWNHLQEEMPSDVIPMVKELQAIWAMIMATTANIAPKQHRSYPKELHIYVSADKTHTNNFSTQVNACAKSWWFRLEVDVLSGWPAVQDSIVSKVNEGFGDQQKRWFWGFSGSVDYQEREYNHKLRDDWYPPSQPRPWQTFIDEAARNGTIPGIKVKWSWHRGGAVAPPAIAR